MKKKTLFSGQTVVIDTMIIIHFFNLAAFQDLVNWAKGEIIVEKRVQNEADYSKFGAIDLNSYFEEKSLLSAELKEGQQEDMFLEYFMGGVNGKKIHEGESACLALALCDGHGLVCDEKEIRAEFNKKTTNTICLNSWGIVKRAKDLGIISQAKKDDLISGLNAMV